jgi:hypothetical protein
MKKIDKSKILSKEYLKWMESLKEEHPKYSSSHKYMKDIKMNLLYCQNGLCAYTEEQLCDLELLNESHWKEGRYVQSLEDEDLINGDLEHFDCGIKEKQAYLWNNLFMANSNINCRIKGTKPINPILKPDTTDYDPFKYLEFDDKINKFLPNINLSEQEKLDVEEMINTLGINKNSFKRAKQIKDLKEDFELELDLKEPHEYITSWKMTLKNLKEKNA